MTINQIYQLLNQTITPETFGEVGVVAEDLSNIVSVGNAVLSVSTEKFINKLTDVIGRTIFESESYKAMDLGLMKDAWTYGSVLQKISIDDLPTTSQNDAYNLVNGNDYSPNKFYSASSLFGVKYWNKKITFEIDLSIPDYQVNEAFKSVSGVASFVAMLYNAINSKIEIELEALEMRLINDLMGEVLHDEVPNEDYGTKTGNKAVNLLKLYNDAFPTDTTTEDACIKKPEFGRFASYIMSLYVKRLQKPSKLYNIGGKLRWTTPDRLHIVALKEFTASIDTYLQADVRHNEFTKLPNGVKEVAFWQGPGTDFGFDSTSSIHVNTANGDEVVSPHILAVMFDDRAMMICNEKRRTDTAYNPKANFTNVFSKVENSYFTDLNENAVVFYVQDAQ